MKRRLIFLDGLRGIAALQIVFLHYASAFIPAIGLLDVSLVRHTWERHFIASPLFFLFDGYLSVYLFFLISGSVLTYSFSVRPFALFSGLSRRLVRLGLPMTASVLLSVVLLALMPTAHFEAGRLSGSAHWLAVISPPVICLQTILREIFLSGMLAGHVGDTILPNAWTSALQLTPASQSFNSPLWTLHWEFFGSLIVLMLVAIRARYGKLVHLVMSTIALWLLGAQPLGLFVVGHLMAPLPLSPPWQVFARHWSGRLLAVIFIAFGMATSAHSQRSIPHFFQWMQNVLLLRRLDDFHIYGLTGAVLIFVGVMASPQLWKFLSTPPLKWLGQMSFSIYLTHFAVLITLASGVFVLTQPLLYSTVIASVVGIGLSIGFAIAFERYVDRPAIRLSRRLGLHNSDHENGVTLDNQPDVGCNGRVRIASDLRSP